MLPATLITSYAFMLPVSTPPNAIAYSYGHLKMMDMVSVWNSLQSSQVLIKRENVLNRNWVFNCLLVSFTLSKSFRGTLKARAQVLFNLWGVLSVLINTRFFWHWQVKAGSFLNIIGFVIAIASVEIFGPLALNTQEQCPEWLTSDFCNGMRDNSTMVPTVATSVLDNATQLAQCIANCNTTCYDKFTWNNMYHHWMIS